MTNHYETLSINSSATADEIRRAYRILARRYHPDLNPGKNTEDKFKQISEAYAVLSDPEKRRLFDIEHQASQARSTKASAAATASARARRAKAWQKAEQAEERARATMGDGAFWRSGAFREPPPPRQDRKATPKPDLSAGTSSFLGSKSILSRAFQGLKARMGRRKPSDSSTRDPSARVTIIEASVSFKDAVFGTKKTVEIQEPEGTRKVSVKIPPGVRNGTVIRLRSKESNEEIILIVRLAYHPFLQIQPKGLILEAPITVGEALYGASITVPTLDDAMVLRVPPGTQSGSELRLKERGILQKDGSRGDLFVRIMIYVPETPEAPGLKEKIAEVDKYYANSVRARLPRSLLDEG